MSIFKINSRIRQVGTFLKVNPKKFHIIFKSTSESFFLNPGIALNWTDELDMQELDIILQLLDISGNGWQDELLGKKACLIVESKEHDDGTLGIEIKAIGRPEKKQKKTKDKKNQEAKDTQKTDIDVNEEENSLNGMFLVLNSGVQLLPYEKAMELIEKKKH